MNIEAVVTKREVTFKAAHRVNQSITAAAEKRALQWMAARMPGWVSSDQLTLLGLLAQVGAGVGYAISRFDRRALLAVMIEKCSSKPALKYFKDIVSSST